VPVRRLTEPLATFTKGDERMEKKDTLTTNTGLPVVDNQNIMTAGPL
jgi:catalase